MSIGETIKKERTRLGLSQRKLGDKCNPKIDASNIRRIENGSISPTADTINRIAVALGVPLTSLFSVNSEQPLFEINYDDTYKDEMLSRVFSYIDHPKLCGKNEQYWHFVDGETEYHVPSIAMREFADNLIEHSSIELRSFVKSHSDSNYSADNKNNGK